MSENNWFMFPPVYVNLQLRCMHRLNGNTKTLMKIFQNENIFPSTGIRTWKELELADCFSLEQNNDYQTWDKPSVFITMRSREKRFDDLWMETETVLFSDSNSWSSELGRLKRMTNLISIEGIFLAGNTNSGNTVSQQVLDLFWNPIRNYQAVRYSNTWLDCNPLRWVGYKDLLLLRAVSHGTERRVWGWLTDWSLKAGISLQQWAGWSCVTLYNQLNSESLAVQSIKYSPLRWLTPGSYLDVEPVVEGPKGDVLEDELEAEVLVLADAHEEEDGGMGDTTEVLQLRLPRLLPHRHLGQVPELPHHPALPAHREHQAVPHQLECCDNYSSAIIIVNTIIVQNNM